MREIKFRAWNTRSVPSKMMYWGKDFYNISLKNGHFNIGESPGNEHFSLHVLTDAFFKGSMPSCQGDVILMQYTGLEDGTKWEDLTEEERKKWVEAGNKSSQWNGKEIYEGDIISDGYIIREIEYCGGQFHPFNEYLDERDRFTFRGGLYAFKIIGNIYENPELLEK